MALTDEEYKALGEAEYMIDDALVVAAPITFGEFCENMILILKNMILILTVMMLKSLLLLRILVIYFSS